MLLLVLGAKGLHLAVIYSLNLLRVHFVELGKFLLLELNSFGSLLNQLQLVLFILGDFCLKVSLQLVETGLLLLPKSVELLAIGFIGVGDFDLLLLDL